MSIEQSPLSRDFTGFVAGGLTAGAASALVFLAFFPFPSDPNPTDHNGAVLASLILVTSFCGGVIGRRGISADFLSDLIPSITGSYIVSVFLCITASLDWGETSMLIGFESVGLCAGLVVSLSLARRFPLKPSSFEA